MLNALSTIIVVLCWFVYLPMFLGKSSPGTERKRSDPLSRIGIAFHAAGVVVMWGWRRPLFSPLGIFSFPTDIVAPLAAILIAAGSVWFSWISLKTLGQQWSFVAGVTAEHQLVQSGPYAVVRHPLYSCFFGLTLATGLVWTERAGLAIALIPFWIGVWIRVRTEEKTLRDTFGAEFDDYVRRVPAFFPRVWEEKNK